MCVCVCLWFSFLLRLQILSILQDLTCGYGRLFHSASFLGRNRMGKSKILLIIFNCGGWHCGVKRGFDGSGALKGHRGGIGRQVAHRRRARHAHRSGSDWGDALTAGAAQLSEFGRLFYRVRVRVVRLVGAFLSEAFDDALVWRCRRQETRVSKVAPLRSLSCNTNQTQSVHWSPAIQFQSDSSNQPETPSSIRIRSPKNN